MATEGGWIRLHHHHAAPHIPFNLQFDIIYLIGHLDQGKWSP